MVFRLLFLFSPLAFVHRSQLSSGSRRRNLVVEQTGQEIRIVLARDLGREIPRGQLELVSLGGLLSKRVGLLLEQTERICFVDALALGGGDVVSDPLPQLASGDFGGSGVLLERMIRMISMKMFRIEQSVGSLPSKS